jgi:hypothetical protein
MSWVYFNSRAIQMASYNQLTRELLLVFTNGDQVYSYPNIPPATFEGLLRAPSKGTYYDRYIRKDS